MTNIHIDPTKIVNGYKEKHDDLLPITNCEIVATGDSQIQLGSFGRQKQYILKTNIGITFWANDVQKSDAVKRSLRTLNERLYSDIKSLVREVIQEIHNGDKDHALSKCDYLLDYMKCNY